MSFTLIDLVRMMIILYGMHFSCRPMSMYIRRNIVTTL